MYAHRKSRGYKPANFSDNHTVEVLWTVIPFLIVVGIGVYATPAVMAQKDTSNADLTIKVTGYQWKWGYEYLKGEGEGIKFLSTLITPYEQRINVAPKTNDYLLEVDNPLVVPVNKKVRVVITANDVIHAWSVPALGVKQDSIPGFVRDSWFKARRLDLMLVNVLNFVEKIMHSCQSKLRSSQLKNILSGLGHRWLVRPKKYQLALQSQRMQMFYRKPMSRLLSPRPFQ